MSVNLCTVPPVYAVFAPLNSASRCFIDAAMISLRCSRDTPLRNPLRDAAPMSYMLTVATAFSRGSILASLTAKLPDPQMPITPILSASTSFLVDK